MVRSWIGLTIVALSFGEFGRAEAATLYMNGTGNESGNNPLTYSFVAQDFVLAQDSFLQNLTFNVYTVEGETIPPTAAHLKIFTDVGGTVGSELFSGDFSVADLGPTGTDGFYTFRDYSVSLPSWFLPGGQYYLALKVDPDQWDFHRTITTFDQIGDPSYESASGDSGTFAEYGFEHAFTLSGNEVASAVPEPTSMALVGMATLSLAGYGWRRRKTALAI